MKNQFKVTAQTQDYKTEKVLTERLIGENLTETQAQALVLKDSLLNEGEYFAIYSPFTKEEEEEDMSARDMAEREVDAEELLESDDENL